MPTVFNASLPSVGGPELPSAGEPQFPLWSTWEQCWLRDHGRTRVLLIDDQYDSRQRLLDVRNGEPLTEDERRLRDWLNVDIEFFPMPRDYEWTGDTPRGTFNDAWFEETLRQVCADPRPIAAIMLDLLFGDEARPQDASGRRFLALLRKQLPGVPVLIMSNILETPEVDGILKRGDGATGETSFQDYLPKVDREDARTLLARLADKLIEWGEISAPQLCAFSPAMRTLACQARKLVLRPEYVWYEERNAQFPRPVVLEGPFGSGKNYVATQLHAMSTRRGMALRTVNFGALEVDTVTKTLFGVGGFTDATEYWEVRLKDAAVLGKVPRTRIRESRARDTTYLAQIGVLQQAQSGTVLLDEIGTAPEEAQTRLLGLFNNGRFNPHLTSVQLPEEGGLDVWLLVTLSPEGQSRIRLDLASRLAKGIRLVVPALVDRKQDILPLALGKALEANRAAHPDDVFTKRLQEDLAALPEEMQVRDLEGLLAGLRDVTSKPPYSQRDLEAVRSKQRLRVTPASTSQATQLVSSAVIALARHHSPPATQTSDQDRTSEPDPLTILSHWRAGVGFPGATDQLRGRGPDVVGGAAAAVLSFLEACAKAIHAVNNDYSPVGIWNLFAGETKTATGDARTRIAALFLIDCEVSLEFLKKSEDLLGLVVNLGNRRAEVRTQLIARLENEPAQRERIAVARATKKRSVDGP